MSAEPCDILKQIQRGLNKKWVEHFEIWAHFKLILELFCPQSKDHRL